MSLASQPDLASALPALRQAMLEHGIDRIRIEYSGYGDSGDLFDIAALRQDQALSSKEWPQAVQDQASAAADAFIARFHSGYQNNEGGGGTLYIDANGLASLQGYWHEVVAEYHDEATIDPKPCASTPGSTHECLQANLDAIKHALHQACAEKNLPLRPIIISYSGYGDSGDYQDIEGLDESLMTVNLQGWRSIHRHENGQWGQRIEAVRSTIHALLCDVADDIVDTCHAGYENNEGGGGEITFDPHAGRATWRGYDNVDSQSEFAVHLISPDVAEHEWPALLDEAGLQPEDIHALTDEQADIQHRLASPSPSSQT